MGRKARSGNGICGVLPVDKPAGMTSHDVVDRVRGLLGIRRIGHTGTLDPAAEGLLLLMVGSATRFARYLEGMGKTYRAVIRLGRVTDTLDEEGETVAEFDGDLDAAVTGGRLEDVLDGFTGTYEQRPPAYSAKKVGGVPAYKLARKGIEPKLEPVAVSVGRIDLQRVDLPDVELELDCSAGFYMRALARDVGEELGTGAYLRWLRRTRVGEVGLEKARPLDELAGMGRDRTVAEALMTLDEGLAHMPAVRLTDADVKEIFHGRQVELIGGSAVEEGGARVPASGETPVRIIDSRRKFLGVGLLDEFRGGAGALRPRRLLSDAFPAELKPRGD